MAQNVQDKPIKTNDEVRDFLNTVVATQGLFYVKLHQAHWYVKGPSFFELHEKFEELYDVITEQMDAVAERLLAIGGEPYSTMTEFLEHSLVQETPSYKGVDQGTLVERLVEDYRIIQIALGKGIDLADDAKDDITTDMLIEQKTQVDETIWMLQAFLGKGALDN
jgi:starvation-inducible DNA-binding protein